VDKAILRFDYSNREQIDSENGVVRGCRLAEVNRVAVFAGKDGKPCEINIRPELIDQLLNFAKADGRLDAYWTHDRLSKQNRDPLHDKVGVWENFRKDESGNFIADLKLAPTQYREQVLWTAKEDPKGIMTSLVFEYTGGKENATALGLSSADLVDKGAATTALLSAYEAGGPDTISDTASKTMDITELVELLKNPEALNVISGACKSAMKAMKDAEAPETEDTAPAEAAMSILPEDKKPEDEKLSAPARLAVWGNRAALRVQTAALASVSEAAGIKALATLTAKIGNGTLSIPSAPEAGKDAKAQFNAKVAELTAKGVRHAAAVQAVMAQHADLYEQAERALFVKPVKL